MQAASPSSPANDGDRELESLLDGIAQAKVRLRELLSERELQLRMAARLASVGGWAVQLRPGRFVPSREWLEILAAEPGRVVPATGALRLFGHAARAVLLEAFRGAVGEGRPFDLVLTARTFGKREIHLRLIGEPRRDRTGAVVSIHGACQDVTAPVAREREATRVAQRLTNTLESLTEALITVDREWCITYVNAAAERITRRQRQDLLGRVLWEVYPQALNTRFHREYETALAENRPRVFQEYWAPHQTWLELRAYPSEQGLAIYFLDVTLRRAMEQELEQHRQQLESLVQERTRELRHANEELNALTVAVAQDLRAPLDAIAGFGKALAGLLPPGEAKPRHYLGRVEAGVERMQAMIRALIALAGVGQAHMHKRQLDLSAIATDVAKLLQIAHGVRQLEVQAGLSAGADSGLVRTLLENLLGNAWKFTAGVPQAAIRVGRGPGGAFFVQDNGVGFDRANAENLFSPFKRYHAEEEFQGTGVGLAAARRVVRRHGGAIWAESAPGQGATIWFTLDAETPVGPQREAVNEALL